MGAHRKGLAALTTSALGAMALLAWAPPGHASPAGIVRDADSARDRDARGYWTPQRIREAEPRPLRQGTGFSAASAPIPEPRGEPGSIPPSYPRSAAARLGDYGTFQVDDPKARPARMTGKVLARDESGNYSCSATVVNSSTEKVIFTAAHCVRTKRWGWAKKFTFIPAYDRGDKPFGKWEWESLYVPTGWSGLKYDYAAVSLQRRNGQED